MKNKKEKEIKNVINFYLLANNSKYNYDEYEQSEANKTYGRMILAAAINSEYNETNNLGKTLTILLLKGLTNTSIKSLNKCISELKDGEKFYKYLTEDSKARTFAEKCIHRERALEYFFESYLIIKNVDIENFDRVFELAEERKILDLFGNDKNKNAEIFRFYYLNRVLKNKVRSGWDDKHWNIKTERREVIAEHVIGTVALALAINSEFDFDIDINKVIETLTIHEIGEISIGDITPFDNISAEEKKEKEHKAMEDILGGLTDKKSMLKRLFKFDERKGKNYKYAFLCDKLDADFQAKVYQDLGYQNSLSEQENNKVFMFDKTKKMVEDGAQTAFDIWYLYDKDFYKKDKEFSKVLKYAKKNDLVEKGE